MSQSYSKNLKIPPDFPEILRNFTREVLRNQGKVVSKEEILRFGSSYFHKLVQQRDGEHLDNQEEIESYLTMSNEEIAHLIQELFVAADEDNSGSLDQSEFKKVFKSMSEHLKLSKKDIMRIAGEADEDENGVIEYKEFLPVAIQIIQSLRAQHEYKEKQHKRAEQAEEEARTLLLHGMPRDEVQSLLKEIFHRSDIDNNGSLSRSEFMNCIKDSDLGFTRKEINILMNEVDNDGDGKITYHEFVPLCFELLVQIYSNELIQVPKDEENLMVFFSDLFAAQDHENTGFLSIPQLRDVLRSADIGLTRIQITAILSEAHEDAEGYVEYEQFARAVSGMILSLLDFEKQHRRSTEIQAYRQTDAYHSVHGLNRHEFEHALNTAFQSMDQNGEGIISRSDLREAIQNAIPNIDSREIRALLALCEPNERDLYSYIPILDSGFQAIQWLQEHDATSI